MTIFCAICCACEKEDATEEVVTILGDSQTFLGVIVTLSILCVMMNQNNFIINILKEIKQNLMYALAYYDVKDFNPNKAIKHIKKHRIFMSLLKNYNKDDSDLNEDEVSECKALYDTFSGLEFKLRDEIARKRIDNIEYIDLFKLTDDEREKKIGKFLEDNIHDDVLRHETFVGRTKEQTAAPLYTFLFGIWVFVVDQIVVRFFPSTLEFSRYFLCFFTCLSIYFWIAKWIFWLKRTNRKYLDKVVRVTSKYETVGTERIILKICLTAVIILIITISARFWYFEIHNMAWFWNILGILLLIFSFAHGLWRFSVKNENYNKAFVINHQLYIIGASLAFAILMILFMPDQKPVMAEDKWLLMGMLSFSLLNGVLAPFFLPYFKYRRILSVGNIELKTNKYAEIIKMQKELEEVMKKFEHSVKKIKKKIF